MSKTTDEPYFKFGEEPSPRGLFRVWPDRQAVELSVPYNLSPTTARVPVVSWRSNPVDRVSVWLLGITRTSEPYPDLEVTLSCSPLAGISVYSDVGSTTKNLAALGNDPFVMQVSGIRAPTWAVWLRSVGALAAPVSVRLGILADRSGCCLKTVIT